MIYVVSDLHGYSLERFKTILERVSFSKNDCLYVLGDVIDRGADGVNLLKWFMRQPNIKLILGNHEAMLLACDFLFEGDGVDITHLHGSKYNAYATWISNSGSPTLNALSATRNSEINYILDYLAKAALYKEIKVSEKRFLLTHSGFGSFDKDKELYEYSADELLWNRPNIDDEYYDDTLTVFGHTPTVFFGENYKGRAVKTNTWIDIDVGAGLGLNPMLLRLDDLREFYFDDNLNLIK